MIAIYEKSLDGLCSAAIMNKYFSCIGIKIDKLISIQNTETFPINIIKQNESLFILNHFLNSRDWGIILSKTKNLVLINSPVILPTVGRYNPDSTSILTWKFFFGFKSIPYIVKLVDNIILNRNCELTENFKSGIEIEDVSPNSNFWNNGLNNIDSTINRVLNNGKIINSFRQMSFI